MWPCHSAGCKANSENFIGNPSFGRSDAGNRNYAEEEQRDLIKREIIGFEPKNVAKGLRR